jgi:hypothetical protein
MLAGGRIGPKLGNALGLDHPGGQPFCLHFFDDRDAQKLFCETTEMVFAFTRVRSCERFLCECGIGPVVDVLERFFARLGPAAGVAALVYFSDENGPRGLRLQNARRHQQRHCD